MKSNDLFSYHRDKARRVGYRDACMGDPKDASRYGARSGSAWAKWYGEGYDETVEAIRTVENMGDKQ